MLWYFAFQLIYLLHKHDSAVRKVLRTQKTLSTFRHKEVHENLGVNITTGPIAGLTARSVIVLDENNNVLHSELVSEIKDEPNYEAALATL